MKRPSPLSMDFAALRTLRLVYETRSFTDTAVILGINQSAVSYTIEKLRRAFNDTLFFRQSGKVIATERCGVIVVSVVRMLDEIEALATPDLFDPSAAEHVITIASNYYERQIIIPPVVGMLRQQAPGIRIHALNSTSLGDQQLKRSEADLLSGPMRPDGNEFFSRTLLEEQYVCVMDKENPLARSPLTLDSYVQAPHATVNYGGTWRSRYLVQLDGLGLKLNTALEVPSPAGLEIMISGTDLIATVPSRIARTFGQSVVTVDCPCPSPFEIYLVWTRRTHKSAPHVWLRELIMERVRTCLS